MSNAPTDDDRAAFAAAMERQRLDGVARRRAEAKATTASETNTHGNVVGQERRGPPIVTSSCPTSRDVAHDVVAHDVEPGAAAPTLAPDHNPQDAEGNAQLATASATAVRLARAAARAASDDHAVRLALAGGVPPGARAMARAIPGMTRGRAARAMSRLGISETAIPDLEITAPAGAGAPMLPALAPAPAGAGILDNIDTGQAGAGGSIPADHGRRVFKGADGCTLDSGLELELCDRLCRDVVPHRSQVPYAMITPWWGADGQLAPAGASADFQLSPRVVVEVGWSKYSDDIVRRQIKARAAAAAGLKVYQVRGLKDAGRILSEAVEAAKRDRWPEDAAALDGWKERELRAWGAAQDLTAWEPWRPFYRAWQVARAAWVLARVERAGDAALAAAVGAKLDTLRAAAAACPLPPVRVK